MSIQTTYPEFYLNGILCQWHIVMEGQQMAHLVQVMNSAPDTKVKNGSIYIQHLHVVFIVKPPTLLCCNDAHDICTA